MDMAMMMTIMILILTDGMWRVLESLVGDREEGDARGVDGWVGGEKDLWIPAGFQSATTPGQPI